VHLRGHAPDRAGDQDPVRQGGRFEDGIRTGLPPADVHAKASKANQATCRLRAGVLRHPKLPDAAKANIIQGLVHSRLTFSAAVYCAPVPAAGAYRTAYMRPMRVASRIVYDHSGPSVPDSDLLIRYALPKPEDATREARIRMLGRIAVAAPPYLAAIIDTEQSWLADAQSDLAWAWKVHGFCMAQPDPMDNLPAWIACARGAHGRWKKAAAAFFRAAGRDYDAPDCVPEVPVEPTTCC